MSVRKSLYLFLAAVMLLGTGEGFARPQSEATTMAGVPEGGVPRYIKPETPEQRQARLGTAEDPGPDPDEKKIFYRFGKQYTIFKVEKRWAKYMPEPGWVKPLANVNFTNEIYQENDKYIWVWNEVIDKEALLKKAAEEESPWNQEAIEYFTKLRRDFEPLEARTSSTRIRFKESSNGLPPDGSWRNGAAVADMNADGFLDLVLPPQRGQAGAPMVFLGDGKGGWTRWKIRWPRAFNYGTVVAADFNKDKHFDLAFSIHLTGVAVFLGDGKGGFTEVTKGLEQHYPSRRMVTADVDADGWMDIVAISEGPVGRGRDLQDRLHGNLRAYLNRDKGRSWEGINLAEPKEPIGGDYLSVGTFNDDRYPDFVGASVYFNSAFTLFVSKAQSEYDPLLDGMLVPGRSYYQATTTGRFVNGAKTDDAIVSFLRYWPENLESRLVARPPVSEISGLDRISFADGEPRRTPIVRWKGAQPVRGAASGDFDGDGNLDVAYTTSESTELNILLGDGKGGFRRAEVGGIELPPQRTYDLVVRDLNGDKKADVMVMFEAKQATAFSKKNGSVRVYLNEGAETR
jgi:hypothetical protein